MLALNDHVTNQKASFCICSSSPLSNSSTRRSSSSSTTSPRSRSWDSKVRPEYFFVVLAFHLVVLDGIDQLLGFALSIHSLSNALLINLGRAAGREASAKRPPKTGILYLNGKKADLFSSLLDVVQFCAT